MYYEYIDNVYVLMIINSSSIYIYVYDSILDMLLCDSIIIICTCIYM